MNISAVRNDHVCDLNVFTLEGLEGAALSIGGCRTSYPIS